MKICGGIEFKAEKDEFFRQVSDQLGRLDYSELYNAYSGMIRKSQVEPRILFEILVCAYMLGVYTSRKIEQLCRNHIQFILILDGHEPPDHTTIARFRSGKATGAAIEGLFQQYTEMLIQEGWIDKDELYIDGTKIESKANRYTFVWRKTVERELGKIREKAREHAPGDYYLCKNGRILSRIGTTTEQSKDGSKREVARYRSEDCRECPYREACCKAKDPEKQKELIICHELSKYREESLKRITTEEGKLLRVNRSIQAEGAFGQLKHNRGFVRFLTAGNVKVKSELMLLAISQNIQKVISKRNAGKLETHILHPAAYLKF